MATALAVATGVGVDVGGNDAGQWLDAICAGSASGATGGWAASHTEAAVRSTSSISGPLSTDCSCGGCWSHVAELEFDDEDRCFPNGAMASLRT